MEEDLWKDDDLDGKTTCGGTASLLLYIIGLRVQTGETDIWRRTGEEIRARCGLSRRWWRRTRCIEEYEVVWAAESVWTLWRRYKLHPPVENRKRFLRQPSRGLDAIPTELWNWSCSELRQQMRLLNEQRHRSVMNILTVLWAETERLLFKPISVYGVSSQLHTALLTAYIDAAPSLQRTNFRTIPTYL